MIKKPEFSNKIVHTNVSLGQKRVMNAFREISEPFSNPWKKASSNKHDSDDLYGDKPYWTKVPMNKMEVLHLLEMLIGEVVQVKDLKGVQCGSKIEFLPLNFSIYPQTLKNPSTLASIFISIFIRRKY